MAKRNKNRSEYLGSIKFDPSSYRSYYLVDTTAEIGSPNVLQAVKIDRIEPAKPKDPEDKSWRNPMPTIFLYPAGTEYRDRSSKAVAYEYAETTGTMYSVTAAEREAAPSLNRAIGKVTKREPYAFRARLVGAPKITVKGRRGHTYEQDAPFEPAYSFEEARQAIFADRVLKTAGYKLPKLYRIQNWLRELSPGTLRAVAVDCGVDVTAAWAEYKSFKPTE